MDHLPNITEFAVIFFVVFLLFGANRLPDVGKNLGEGIRNFKKALTGENDKPKEE
ncbi:MAG: twin-arginine translocase TatA/TatE family subunit [Candidatus Nanopusillus acidilobi]|jgi:sec-independent protein translocase protein TatA